MSDCCKSGFKWDAQPTGTETKLGELNAYVAGNSKSAAVLIVADIFGWTLPNIRVIADHFAKEANVTVYVPDLYVVRILSSKVSLTVCSFDGEVVKPEFLEDPELRKTFSIPEFIGRHSKDIRWPSILESAKLLKSQYPKLGAIGYCYGAWAVFKLAADSSLIDSATVAHPSLLEKSEIDGLKVPTQILAPEHDHAYTPELKEYSNKVIPTLNIPYDYVYFPGVAHGFAARGDPNNPTQKQALERAKRAAVNWFNEWLH